MADLSSVWVEAEIYENDIAFLQPGQKVEATVEAYPNRTFTGEVASIYPRVEATTRTNRIRVRLENPNNELRPGMFAAVTIDTPLETIEPYKTLAAKTARMILVGQKGGEPKPQQEFLVVPNRPWSIPARRRSFMSSATGAVRGRRSRARTAAG